MENKSNTIEDDEIIQQNVGTVETFEVSTEQNKNESPKKQRPEDKITWIISMILLVIILGASWIWGNAKNWYAQSGYGYSDINGTGRFPTEPFYCNDTSEPGRSGLPDCTASWYFWKLHTDRITPLTRGIMWLMYSSHQIFIWALIYKAQLEMSPEGRKKRNDKGPKYSGKMRWYNYALLIVNGVFHVLHLIQTHWTYDGISQDVSLSSSQASVILVISLIMLIEYRDRGIILMWPNPRSDDRFSKKLRLNQKPINYVRKYHGYYFAWSIVYTFWYHPMENTWAHTSGFLHTGIVLIQGSLIYTDMHLNRFWRLINECWVMFHGAIVALQTANPDKKPLWPNFFFGFGFLLFFTQIFVLPFWKHISPWYRLIPPILFYIAAISTYATSIPGGLSGLWQTVAIPAIQYLNMFLAWLFIYVLIALENYFRSESCFGPPTPAWNVIYVVSFLFVYSLIIMFSVFFKYIEVMFLLLMQIFTLVFIIAAGLSFMILKRILGPFRSNPTVSISTSQR